MKRYVIKLGGSAITNQKQNKPEILTERLISLSDEIKQIVTNNIQVVLILVVGPFGHIPARKYSLKNGLKTGEQEMGMAITHNSVQLFCSNAVKIMQECGLKAMEINPSSTCVLNNGQIDSFNTEPITNAIKHGIIPVLYGDVIFDKTLGCAILSGDYLTPYIASILNAEAITGTDTQVYDKDPQLNTDAKPVKILTNYNFRTFTIDGSTSINVTGGMYGKVKYLLDYSEKGLKSRIIDITVEGNLKKAILGNEEIGTLIPPAEKHTSNKH